MNKIKKRIFSFALILLSFFSAIFLYKPIVAMSLDSPVATICVDPPTITARVGQNFTININVSDVSDLYGWEFNLTWNPILLDFVNVTQGPFLKRGGNTFFTYKNETGYILVDCTLLGDVPGVSGDGILATVEFYVEREGECVLDLYDTKLVNSLEQPIFHDSFDGYFSALAPEGPTAKFTYLAPYPYRTVTFNASTSLPGWNGTYVAPVVNYKWNFGDGNITSVPYPIIYHTYAENGTYTVTLNVTDSQGLWNTTSKTITLSPDIAIIHILPYTDGVYPTWTVPLQIKVTTKNEGVTHEDFEVSLCWNITNIIGTQSVVNLAPEETKTLTFDWDFPPLPGYPNNPPEAYPYPTYIISANASTVLNETDTKDNTLTDGTITVRWPGDATGDGKVNIYDLTKLALSWKKPRTDPKYNPLCDFTGDGEVNIYDLTKLAKNWHKGPLD